MKKSTVLAILLGVFALAFIPTANAGKLANGLRGIPYGNPAKLLTKLRAFPADDCQNVRMPQSGDSNLPACIVNVGRVQTVVIFGIIGGRYVGFTMHVMGYGKAKALFTSLKAAWGEGTITEYPSMGDLPYEYRWRDGKVVATFKYNYSNDKVEVVVGHQGEVEKMNKTAAKAAESGASDL